MLIPIKNKAVNWVDGMKISKDHFIAMENYYNDIIRDTTSFNITSFNYGLLPPYAGEGKSSDFVISERVTNHVDIELRRCNAITSGGCRIDINPTDHTGYLTLEHSFSEDSDIEHWDILLMMHPFSRVPVGEFDADETPPRHPYVAKLYELHVVPAGQQLSGSTNHLVIGRVSKVDEHYQVDESFIPPSTSISSHPELVRYYEHFGKQLNDLELSAHKIIQKIQEKEKPSQVAKNVSLICQRLIDYIGTIYFDYRNKNRYLAPIDTISYFSSLAHTLFGSLNLIKKQEREELLKYFYEWSDVTPGNFSEMLSSMLEIVYNHNKIRNNMRNVNEFIDTLTFLWIKLSNLEYIGQHKENIVVAHNTQVEQKIETRKGWTLLD